MALSSAFMLKNLVIIIVLLQIQSSKGDSTAQNGLKTEVFLTPEIILEPGLVSDKFYFDIDFPRGHIALKGFHAEIVDNKGDPVPLHQTYLHHWVLERYYSRKYVDVQNHHGNYTIIANSGICGSNLKQYYGVGAETRKTDTDVPDPYGIEIGDPTSVPEGYKEGWFLNVHAIDIRGVEDKMGCTECRCDLYNVTADENRQLLQPGYKGGLRCCKDERRCKVKEGFKGEKRSLFLRYTVKYVDWDYSLIVPVKIYIFDVTDVLTRGDKSRGVKGRHNCKVEYDVDEYCPVGEANKNGCVHSKTTTFSFPNGGDVIYGVGHQHAGGIGTTVYGEGGRVICASNPSYGKGEEAGNEAGFIVGMSTCYPKPGSVQISAGETLTFVSNYSSEETHTGVMGLFYLLVADPSPKPLSLRQKISMVSNLVWPAAALFAVAVFAILKSRRGVGEGYEAII